MCSLCCFSLRHSRPLAPLVTSMCSSSTGLQIHDGVSRGQRSGPRSGRRASGGPHTSCDSSGNSPRVKGEPQHVSFDRRFCIYCSPHTHTRAYIHTYPHTYVHTHLHTHTHMCIHTHLHAHTCVNTHLHAHMRVSVFLSICVYFCFIQDGLFEHSVRFYSRLAATVASSCKGAAAIPALVSAPRVHLSCRQAGWA